MIRWVSVFHCKRAFKALFCVCNYDANETSRLSMAIWQSELRYKSQQAPLVPILGIIGIGTKIFVRVFFNRCSKLRYLQSPTDSNLFCLRKREVGTGATEPKTGKTEWYLKFSAIVVLHRDDKEHESLFYFVCDFAIFPVLPLTKMVGMLSGEFAIQSSPPLPILHSSPTDEWSSPTMHRLYLVSQYFLWVRYHLVYIT